MSALDSIVGRQKCKWGVFKTPKQLDGIDYNEIHVAPLEPPLGEETDGLTLVERLDMGTTEHQLDGVGCWCKPRRDDEVETLFIHNEVS